MPTDPDSVTDDEESMQASGASNSVLSDARLRSNIGKGLRVIFMDSVREPVPPKLAEIAKRLHRSRK